MEEERKSERKVEEVEKNTPLVRLMPDRLADILPVLEHFWYGKYTIHILA
jgi:hypothetical protein